MSSAHVRRAYCQLFGERDIVEQVPIIPAII
jgi:hypothetical protein